MSNSKSKFPDLKELANMGNKFLKGLKSSVDEIICDYKKKRGAEKGAHAATSTAKTASTAKKTTASKPKVAKKPTVKKTAVKKDK